MGSHIKLNDVTHDMEKMSWWQEIIARFFPKLFFWWHARKMGIDTTIYEKAHEAFSRTHCIDLLPSRSGSRGFQIILDHNTALYFYQDGDHFVYDGFEMGEYDEGDVTIFDERK